MSKRLSKQRFKTLPTFFKTHRETRASLVLGTAVFHSLLLKQISKSKNMCKTLKQHLDLPIIPMVTLRLAPLPFLLLTNARLTSFVRTWKNLVPLNGWKRRPFGIIIGTSENPFPLKAPSFAANNMEPEIQNPIPKHSMYGILCIFACLGLKSQSRQTANLANHFIQPKIHLQPRSTLPTKSRLVIASGTNGRGLRNISAKGEGAVFGSSEDLPKLGVRGGTIGG